MLIGLKVYIWVELVYMGFAAPLFFVFYFVFYDYLILENVPYSNYLVYLH